MRHYLFLVGCLEAVSHQHRKVDQQRRKNSNTPLGTDPKAPEANLKLGFTWRSWWPAWRGILCVGPALTPELRSDHDSYIDHWLAALKRDNRAIFTAAAHAQRAADYLLGYSGLLSSLYRRPPACSSRSRH
ncbi:MULTISPECIES: zincin-like metallopeptidase domain-containing protein [unclassified Bradyrhizobium]|uniref:zincin-like metallopeptidase domain-containing protein n=1 Tax=unclassified Bradyrhizobium TaxID=2631580 RepID=UPI001606775B